MICPDCEMKVDDLIKSTGTCIACYKRYQNMKYRKEEYVPLKDIKGTKEYNRAMGRRLGAAKRHKAEQKAKVIKTIESKPTKSKVHINTQDEIVMGDILDTFAKNNAEWPKDTTTILPVFHQLNILLDNYIGIYLNAEDILNKMELDYKHAKEYFNRMFKDLYKTNPNSEECIAAKNKKDLWEERHSTLLEKRRGIKNVIAEYNTAGILFTELSKDTAFMKKFKAYYEDLQKINTIVSQGNYRAEISSLVAEEDFCYGFKSNTTIDGKKHYNVTIPTLYRGQRGTFIRQAWSENENEAIRIVTKFIKDNGYKFSWKPNEIVVTEITKEGL